MDSESFVGRFAHLGLRSPKYNRPHHESQPSLADSPAAVVVARTAQSTADCISNPNLCEKPVSASALTVPIALGIAIPLFIAVLVFIYLHRRSRARQEREDAIDIDKTGDFGMSENLGMRKRSSPPHEKTIGHKNHQMSVDLDLSTPYLLPPALTGSHDSLHSLARSLHNEDPYRPVTSHGNDGASVRSGKPGNGREGSVRTVRTSASRAGSTIGGPPPRQNSLPKPAPARTLDPGRLDNPADGLSPLPTPSPRLNMHVVAEPMSALIETMPSSPGSRQVSIQQPAPTALKTARGVADRSRPNHSAGPAETKPETSFLNGFDFGLPVAATPSSPIRQFEAMPAPSASPHFQDNHPQFPFRSDGDDYDFDDQGQPSQQRHSLELHMGAPAPIQGLAVPKPADNRRLSVGLRPLPPSDIGESDDPEYRANRIRSFYKEYFEEMAGDKRVSRIQMAPPQQQQGQGPRSSQHQHQHPAGVRSPPQNSRPPPRQGPPQQVRASAQSSNYGDYDDGFLGEGAAYYDPASNSFVMPYAQPVTRRAMTPPPTRIRGNGPPRNARGSIGGMSNGPRPGSSVSNRFGAAGADFRSSSSMSGGRGRNPHPKPRLPAPSALTTIPNPSKLRDDSMVMGTIDFAPPETFADRARGRSQSPVGERRPYKLNVPIHSPLAGADEELGMFPSPHNISESTSLTGLDFAPPRKFGDGDNVSDAGSIRSNRSKGSNVNLKAIRDQVHLPDDTIFASDVSGAKLRPQWNIRG